jgi:hypothetical protein
MPDVNVMDPDASSRNAGFSPAFVRASVDVGNGSDLHLSIITSASIRDMSIQKHVSAKQFDAGRRLGTLEDANPARIV